MQKLAEYLVLIVDSDEKWAKETALLLSEQKIKAVIAYNCSQALEMIEELYPQVIICSVEIPYNEITSIIDSSLNRKFPIPLILTGDNVVYNNPEIKEVLKKSSIDYLLKPFTNEILVKKITQIIMADTQLYEHELLHDFSSFFNRIGELKMNIDEYSLLELSFDYFIKIGRADGAILVVYDIEKKEWVKRREIGEELCNQSRKVVDKIREKIVNEKQSLLYNWHTEEDISRTINSALGIPLLVGKELKGIVILLRDTNSIPFSVWNKEAAELIALQTANAISNISLYGMVIRKHRELKIISSYSEKLIGVVDKYDVIHTLFETALQYLEVDLIGFLIAQRSIYEFLYWTRFQLDEKLLEEISNEAASEYESKCTEINIRKRRIIFNKIKMEGRVIEDTPLQSLAFRHTIPFCWEDFHFGSLVVGYINEPSFLSENLSLLNSLVGQTRIALTNTKLYSDMKENYIRTIKALAIAVDAKDTYTHGHSENVMNIAYEIAQELSIDEKTKGCIRDAGLLHDIGKIGIPGYILNKPGPLTYEEFNGIMKTHSTLGANIVKEVPFLRELYKLILYHHEHYDGKGYPEGLKGEQIPLGARILHVADAFEAMTSDRPYRKSLGRKEAIRRLIEGSGKQFDPAIVAAFLRVAEKKKWLDDRDESHRGSLPFPTVK
ncbi:MAG: HD domain-containing protein [Chitinispirillaceae bacterium]|nr:HD domain-containing protein [Chitinispirillaceae bacterium]